MILNFDEHTKKSIATIEKANRVEQYEFSLLFCDNPVCACNTVHINLSPLGNDNAGDASFLCQISIDVVEKKLAYPPGKKIPKEVMTFAKAFLRELDEKDFSFLWSEYFRYKNKITEEANPDEIEAKFDYVAVEKESLMYAYRDILPFGEQLTLVIDGKKYIIFDSYCLRSGCTCTDTILSIFSAEPSPKKKIRSAMCDVTLSYAKKSWVPYENRELSISVKAARSAIEKQIPDFYKKLKQRHLTLKRIYAHCKKKHYSPLLLEQSAQIQKVGRNAPCPCGSGKKYKKCCMGK